MGLSPGPHELHLVDADPELANAIRRLLGSPKELAQEISVQSEGEAKVVWERARSAPKENLEGAAAWWIWVAGARGGIGGFKGLHKHRANVDGFIPSRESLVKRVREMPDVDAQILCSDCRTWEPEPGTIVYFDPPYAGTTGYGPCLERKEVLELAQKWRDRGCVVGVSEREPLEIPGAAHLCLTDKRKGQSRRSLTRSLEEWLTVLE